MPSKRTADPDPADAVPPDPATPDAATQDVSESDTPSDAVRKAHKLAQQAVIDSQSSEGLA